ncbi:hypothetical protein RCH09_003602 [Actimicrobium sp. GrIS 1.19]|uniref:hypothetical protein n=1 Tax=Actimicrobium sp. GrIS 1.19 TaxID=3071708 RepID=UPI002E08CCBC|nr:hypothetical protein [Actimicrobium sp. GrIS 1.19]
MLDDEGRQAAAAALGPHADDNQWHATLALMHEAIAAATPHQQDATYAALLTGATQGDVGRQAVVLDLVAAHLDAIHQPERLPPLLDVLAAELPRLHPAVQRQAAQMLEQGHALMGEHVQQRQRRQQVFGRGNLRAILEHSWPTERRALLETVAGPQPERQLQLLLDDFPADSQVARHIISSSGALQAAALQDAAPETGLRRAVAVLGLVPQFGHATAPQRAVDRINQHWPARTNLPLPRRAAMLTTLAGALSTVHAQANWQALWDKLHNELNSRDAQGVPTFSMAQRDNIMAALLRNLADSARPNLHPDILRNRHAAIFDQFVHEFDQMQGDARRLPMLTGLSESMFRFHPDVQRRAWPIMANGLAALSTASDRETAAVWLENLCRDLNRLSSQAPQPAGKTLQQQVMQAVLTSAERFAEPDRFRLRMLNAIAESSLANPREFALPPALRQQVFTMMRGHLNAADVPARERVAPLVTMMRYMPDLMRRFDLLAEVASAIDQVRDSDPEAFALLHAARLPYAPDVAWHMPNPDRHFSREIEHGVNQLVGHPVALRELIGAIFDTHRTLAGTGWTIAIAVMDGAMRAVETGVARDRSEMSAADAERDVAQWEQARAMVAQAQENLPAGWRRNLAMYRPVR